MKELSIEEKACRYDEAKYIMKEYLESGNAGVIAENTIKNAFPELKESEEDERIREEIISAVNIYCTEYLRGDKVRKDMIAWLRKQGENVHNEELSKLLNEVICHFINNPDIPYSKRDEVSKKIIPYVEKIEKQGEQKTADNIEKPWSEDDNKHFERILKELKNQWQRPSNRPYLDEIVSDYYWLNSLKYRYTWKPSDEQMEALDNARHSNPFNVHVLDTLLHDLKKLREE